MSKDVARLFPFVLRARKLIVGRERLAKSKHKIQLIMITDDISENSRKEILRDFKHYPIIQHFSTAEFEQFFNLKNTRFIGLEKSSLASSIYQELKAYRINPPKGNNTVNTDNRQIAIDGPAASGKSTVAKRVADALDAYYINTGEMYRTLTWQVVSAGMDPEHDPASVEAFLPKTEIRYDRRDGDLTLTCNGEPVDRQVIRAPQVTAHVSHVAKIPAVREWMVNRQKESAQLGLVVAEGRDIGTVVFPQAKWKFFVTATPMERARRRLAQDGEAADNATLESVAAEIAERDRIDSTRAVSPLKQAEDAILVDTTGLSIEAVIERVLGIIQADSA